MSAETNIREDALALCHAIERIPASEQQTRASIRAAALLKRIDGLATSADKALWKSVGARESACDLQPQAEEAMELIKAVADLVGKPQRQD
jgi:hypothetical protein